MRILFKYEGIMHNLISFNQLAYLNQIVKDVEDNNSNQLITDYFECLTECNDEAQHCKKVCRSMLSA